MRACMRVRVHVFKIMNCFVQCTSVHVVLKITSSAIGLVYR